MPKIKLEIGSRFYEISCNDGDEARITALAQSLDKRVNEVAKGLGFASEAMVLVVTGLMLEDELRNLQSGSAVKEQVDKAVEEALLPFAEKLESLANHLEIG